jgi:hypothetical protein
MKVRPSLSFFLFVSTNGFGVNKFPDVSPEGFQIANEFRLVYPENIVVASDSTDEYSITSVSPLLISNDEIVTVKFTSNRPASTDWIGAYSPASVDITKTVPIKYGYCNEVSSYLTNGTGYLTFNLTNLRSDVKFYYFTGLKNTFASMP